MDTLLAFAISGGVYFVFGFIVGAVFACVGWFFYYKTRLKEWDMMIKNYQNILKEKDTIIELCNQSNKNLNAINMELLKVVIFGSVLKK